MVFIAQTLQQLPDVSESNTLLTCKDVYGDFSCSWLFNCWVTLQLSDNESCFQKTRPFQTNVCCPCADKICQHRNNFCTITHCSTAESGQTTTDHGLTSTWLNTTGEIHHLSSTGCSLQTWITPETALTCYLFFLLLETTDQINKPVCLRLMQISFISYFKFFVSYN